MKSRSLFFVALALSLLAAPVHSSPIAYWEFENDFASSVGGSSLTGTPSGGVTFSADTSTLAPGTRSADFSHGSVKMRDFTNLTGGLTSFTIEAFFKPDTVSQTGTIYSEDDRGDRRSTYLGFFGSFIRFFTNSGPIDPRVVGVEVLDVPVSNLSGTWHHVAASFDGSTQTTSLYLDSHLIGSRSVSVTSVPLTGLNPTIGAWSSDTNFFVFDGKIDEVKITDQAYPIPEPQTFLLMISGIALLSVLRKKSRFAAPHTTSFWVRQGN